MKPDFYKAIVPEYIRKLKAYEPGKPIEEVERELGIRRSIKMASNENPLGPPQKALTAMEKTAKKAHYYPAGDCFYLRRKIVKKLGIKSDELVFGNGTNEIIELLIRCLVRPGDNIIVSEHAFLVYNLIGQGAGAQIRTAPAKHYGHDLAAMAKMVNRKTKLVFIANPNNPTGTYCDSRSLCGFLKSVKDIPVVLDEAYYDYVDTRDYPQTLEMRKKFPNLVITRTFSKIYGLAGLRIGFGIGDAELMQYLNRLRQPFNVNMMAQEAAIAALSDREHLNKSRRMNRDGKKFLYKELAKNDVEFLPTEANFLLIKVGKGRKVFSGMLKLGVVVRPMDVYGLPEFIRVTIGKKEQNAKFISVLTKVLGKNGR
ncbi:MAG: histidinol-phosphate aminotransferase [bacterium]|nr:MAG: histidinol-phosphate aminotransferase [bacterium]